MMEVALPLWGKQRVNRVPGTASSRSSGAEVWKWISGLLAGIIVTGLVAWFTFGASTTAILQSIQNNTKAIDKLDATMSATNTTIGTYNARIAVLESRMERLEKLHSNLREP